VQHEIVLDAVRCPVAETHLPGLLHRVRTALPEPAVRFVEIDAALRDRVDDSCRLGRTRRRPEPAERIVDCWRLRRAEPNSRRNTDRNERKSLHRAQCNIMRTQTWDGNTERDRPQRHRDTEEKVSSLCLCVSVANSSLCPLHSLCCRGADDP